MIVKSGLRNGHMDPMQHDVHVFKFQFTGSVEVLKFCNALSLMDPAAFANVP